MRSSAIFLLVQYAAAAQSNLFTESKWRDCSSSGSPASVGYITGEDTNYVASWAVNPTKSPLLNSGSDLSRACEGLLADGQAGEIYIIQNDPNCTTCMRMAIYEMDAGVMAGRDVGANSNWICSKGKPTSVKSCLDAQLTCGSLKASYKKASCCGNPSKEFGAEDLYPVADDCVDFGFDLVDLTSNESQGMYVPAQESYYSVTLSALIASNHVNYTWIPQTHTNDNAPSGAFVYQMSDGSLLYKNIVPKAVTESPTLAFSCGGPLPMLATFADAEELGKAMMYRSGPVNIDSLPFSAYSKYTWVRLSYMTCGAFVYEVTSKSRNALYYHTCG